MGHCDLGVPSAQAEARHADAKEISRLGLASDIDQAVAFLLSPVLTKSPRMIVASDRPLSTGRRAAATRNVPRMFVSTTASASEVFQSSAVMSSVRGMSALADADLPAKGGCGARWRVAGIFLSQACRTTQTSFL